MDRQILRDFAWDIFAFREQIPIPGTDVDTFLEAAVQHDSRILFYMASISSTRRRGGLSLQLEYRNREVPPDRVYRVWDSRQAQQVLLQEIRGWREHFGIMMHGSLDPKAEVERFLRLNSLSGLYRLGWNRGTCQWGWTYTRFNPEFMADRDVLMDMDCRAQEAAVRLGRRLFLPGMSPEVKCLAAHNYLAAATVYSRPGEDRLEQYRRGSAYGPLVEKKAVCQGYAEAFQRLMNLAGITCLTVSGSTRRQGDENHSWNLVQLPGECFCHVDVTWDSRNGRSAMTYYLRGDAFLEGREWARDQLPPAPGDSRSPSRAEGWLRENRERLLAAGFPPEALPSM